MSDGPTLHDYRMELAKELGRPVSVMEAIEISIGQRQARPQAKRAAGSPPWEQAMERVREAVAELGPWAGRQQLADRAGTSLHVVRRCLEEISKEDG